VIFLESITKEKFCSGCHQVATVSDHSALSTLVFLSWILGPLLQAIVQVSPFVICLIWSIHVVLTCAEVVLANLPSLPFPLSLSQEYVRFCQWKYLELLTPYLISLHDFSIHRIIGRGGFGEVYGCRKDDSGKMLAMKLLDKKRIKVKKGEYLAVNERNMLAKVNSPFVVNLYYAFQTPEKLCFILDLMNGGDLHYHLTQHGVFSENEVRFYAAELVLGLEHIHRQNIVYRDLKVGTNCSVKPYVT
jgi:hypothetical protein